MKKVVLLLAMIVIATGLLWGEFEEKTIGTTTTLSTSMQAINYAQRQFLAQQIFTSAQMGSPASGFITAWEVMYRSTAANTAETANIPIQIWIGTTALSAFPATGDRWVPIENFTQVYDGPLYLETTTSTEFKPFRIHFQQPFEYSAGTNIVIMTYKPYKDDIYVSTQGWSYTTLSNTCLYSTAAASGSASTVVSPWPDITVPGNLNIDNVPVSNSGNRLSSKLIFHRGEAGAVIVTTTNDVTTDPVATTRVNFGNANFAPNVFTDATGSYNLRYVPADTYNLTTSRYGYQAATSSITVADAGNETPTIAMTPIAVDLRVAAFSGRSLPTAGFPNNAYNVTVQNDAGLSSGTDYLVQLLKFGTDEVLVSAPSTPIVDIPAATNVYGPVLLTPSQQSYVLYWNPVAPDTFRVYAKVTTLGTDPTPANNTSAPMFVDIQPAGTITSMIGDPASTSYQYTNFMVHNNYYSFSQSLFYEEEIDVVPGGGINGVTIFARATGAAGVPGPDSTYIKLYIKDTDLMSFSDATVLNNLIPMDEFMLVFDGRIDIRQEAINITKEIDIDFDRPFPYRGGNIAMMIIKEERGTLGATANVYVHTNTTGIYRTLGNNRRTSAQTIAQYPPYTLDTPPTSLARVERYPNVRFYTTLTGLGEITGTVSDAVYTSPASGVKISLNEFPYITSTDASGNYSLPYLAPGTYSINASKFQYIDVDIDDIEVEADAPTLVDFDMDGVTFDLGILSFTGPEFPNAQEPNTYKVKVKNNALLSSQTAYAIHIMKAGTDEILHTHNTEMVDIPAATSLTDTLNIYEYDIEWIPPATDVGEQYQIYAKVELPNDEIESNDISAPLGVFIQPRGTIVSVSGDLNSTATAYTASTTIYHFGRWSINQTLYLESEIDVEPGGLITEINLFYTGGSTNVMGPSELKVHIATMPTTFTEFTANSAAGFVPFANFVPVFDGQIPTHLRGKQTIRIVFDTPYPYTGGNLVVMYRKMETGSNGSTADVYQVWATGANRSIGNSSTNTAENNPYNLEAGNAYPSGTRATSSMVTRFFTHTTGIGSLTGTITNLDDGSPVGGVEVQMDNVWYKAVSDSTTGTYTFPYLPADTYSFTASKFMYTDVSFDDVVVGADTTVTLNFTMQSVPYDLNAVALSGVIFPAAEDTSKFVLRVKNDGYADIDSTDYFVHLYKVVDGEPDLLLLTVPGISLESLEEGDIELIGWIPTEEDDLGKQYIYAVVECEADSIITANNRTENLLIYVQQEKTKAIYVGDRESTLDNAEMPIYFMYNNAVSQLIYLEEDLEPGNINGLVYRYIRRYNDSGTYERPLPADSVYVYLGMTSQEGFASNNEWVPFDQLTLVYAGISERIAEGTDWVIQFDTPYLYSSRNLVVFIHRKKLPGAAGGNYWQTTATTGPRRALYSGQSDAYDITNLNGVGYRNADRFPNTTLLINSKGMGHLTGRVTDSATTEGISGVVVSIPSIGAVTVSDSAGYYSIYMIPEGLYTIEASLYTYWDYDSAPTTVEIEEYTTASFDFTMTKIDTVTIAGVVYGSDFGLPMGGVDIWVRGYKDYHTQTETDGTYEITGVYENRTYDVEVYKTGFMRTFAELIVEDTDILDNDYTLLEKAFAPHNVRAVTGDFAATITWEEPESFEKELYHGPDAETPSGSWTPSYRVAHRFRPEHLMDYGVAGAELAGVKYFLHANSETPGTITIKIHFGTVELSTRRWMPQTLVATAVADPLNAVADDWNTVWFESPIDLPYDQDVWIEYDQAGGTGRGIGFFSSPIDEYDPYVRETVFNYMANITGQPNGFAESTNFVDGTNTRRDLYYHMIRGVVRGAYHPLTLPSNTRSRFVTGYKLSLANVDNLYDENEWIDVADNVAGTEYEDSFWQGNPPGGYRYVVEALYSAGQKSAPAFSNMIEIGMWQELTINLSNNYGETITTGEVMLKNNRYDEPAHQYVYYATLDTLDVPTTIHFTDIWLGEYTLVVSVPGYRAYTDYELDIPTATGTVDIALIKSYAPQAVIAYAETAEERVYLEWEAPVSTIDKWYSHSEADAPSGGWSASGTGSGTGAGNTVPHLYVHRYTPTQLNEMGVAGLNLTRVAFAMRTISSTTGSTRNYKVQIFTGGSSEPWDPGTLIHEQVLSTTSSPSGWVNNVFQEVTLSTPVRIPINQELWIGLSFDNLAVSQTGSYFSYNTTAMGRDAGPVADGYGNLVRTDGNWRLLTEVSSANTYNWCIRGYVEGVDPSRGGNPTILTYNYTDQRVTNASAGLYDEETTNAIFDMANRNTEAPRPYIRNNTRFVEGYRIFRAPADSLDDLTSWVLVEDMVDSLSYYDYSITYAPMNEWYQYIIKTIMDDGEALSGGAYSNAIIKEWAVSTEELPTFVTTLGGNYPNPFNPNTTINYSLKTDGVVTMEIFNIKGQKVTTLINDFQNAGNHKVVWNGKDTNGRDVASGVYFYRMKSDNFVSTKKMILMK